MRKTRTLAEFEIDRRRLLRGGSATALAATQLGCAPPATAREANRKPKRAAAIKVGGDNSFASIRQIDAGLLNVGYAQTGPADGPAVLLLHGWPYDIHSYVDVAA